MKRVQATRKAKPRRTTRKKPRFALIEKGYPGGKSLEFPGMQGRKIEKIELITAGDYHAVSIRFQRKKTLHLVIHPGFTLKANLRDWKDGNGHSSKAGRRLQVRACGPGEAST